MIADFRATAGIQLGLPVAVHDVRWSRACTRRVRGVGSTLPVKVLYLLREDISIILWLQTVFRL